MVNYLEAAGDLSHRDFDMLVDVVEDLDHKDFDMVVEDLDHMDSGTVVVAAGLEDRYFGTAAEEDNHLRVEWFTFRLNTK